MKLIILIMGSSVVDQTCRVEFAEHLSCREVITPSYHGISSFLALDTFMYFFMNLLFLGFVISTFWVVAKGAEVQRRILVEGNIYSEKKSFLAFSSRELLLQ